MSWFDSLFGGQGQGSAPPASPAKPLYQPPGTVDERMAAWELALARDHVPPFVEARLRDVAAGKLPWMSTMTPVELRLARSHGIRPLAMVSGTCWLHYGYSWTKGHAEGWHKALARLRAEARAGRQCRGRCENAQDRAGARGKHGLHPDRHCRAHRRPAAQC